MVKDSGIPEPFSWDGLVPAKQTLSHVSTIDRFIECVQINYKLNECSTAFLHTDIQNTNTTWTVIYDKIINLWHGSESSQIMR